MTAQQNPGRRMQRNVVACDISGGGHCGDFLMPNHADNLAESQRRLQRNALRATLAGAAGLLLAFALLQFMQLLGQDAPREETLYDLTDIRVQPYTAAPEESTPKAPDAVPAPAPTAPLMLPPLAQPAPRKQPTPRFEIKLPEPLPDFAAMPELATQTPISPTPLTDEPAASNSTPAANALDTTASEPWAQEQHGDALESWTAINKPPPIYPPSAARRHREGAFLVEFTIFEDGGVGEITHAPATPKIFSRAIDKAIVQWLFKPKHDTQGQPVRKRVKTTFNFAIEK